ncbi:MAG: flagellar protein FlaG [Syntrophobacteraceae bacterium]
MEARIREVQPMVAESWIRYDKDSKELPLVQPVAKSGTSSRSEEVGKNKTGQDRNLTQQDPGSTQKLVDEVQSYLDNLNIELDFNIREKTGDIVVRVLDRKSGDVIRQLPPDDLLELRDKLDELRGALFDKKV